MKNVFHCNIDRRLVNELTICRAIKFICANILKIHWKLPHTYCFAVRIACKVFSLQTKNTKNTHTHALETVKAAHTQKKRTILIGNLGFGSIEIFKNQIESIVLARNAQCSNICNMHLLFLFFFSISLSAFASCEHVSFGRDATDFNTFIVNGQCNANNEFY